MTYRKVFKWLLVALFVIGVLTSAYGFINGWPDSEVWKNDHAKAAELPQVIKSMEENGVAVLSSSELEAKKAEVAALQEVAKKYSTRTEEIKAEFDKAGNNKARKAAIEKELKPEFDSLTAEVALINTQITDYRQAVELNKHKAELAEIQARIETGNTSVNTIMAGTYVMIGIALLSLFIIIFIVSGINSPMSLVKVLIALIVIGALIGGAYAIAPGTELTQFHGDVPPTAGDLKLTDTVLYLAYLAFGATIVALITSWIVGAVRK